ncbi:MAG: hypothetical protein LBF16_09595 [Pseudomonadales bacterium]|jgi:hypothetical protein|nr:hypothetical protein [Pseudomonadales bacterium]
MNADSSFDSRPTGKRYSGWQVAFFVLLAAVAAMLITGWFVYRVLFPRAFTPTELNPREQQVLAAKIQQIDATANDTPLEPERYRENNDKRTLNFTERELNALIANNPAMAQRFSIALTDKLASAKLLVPVPPDFPVLGGKTVQVNAGLNLSYTNGRPVVVLQGLSLWGVPIPSAWMSGLKNVDLVQEFGGNQGFWRAFADGVDNISVTEGELRIQLKE